MTRVRVVGLFVLAAMASVSQAQETVRLCAAGSLRAAMTEIGTAFTRATRIRVVGEFGASGSPVDRIAKGERADVFASANMEHPGGGRISWSGTDFLRLHCPDRSRGSRVLFWSTSHR